MEHSVGWVQLSMNFASLKVIQSFPIKQSHAENPGHDGKTTADIYIIGY